MNQTNQKIITTDIEFALIKTCDVFVLRPLIFLSRGSRTQAASSECKLTKLILQIGCLSHHNFMEKISPNLEVLSANTNSLYQHRIAEN